MQTIVYIRLVNRPIQDNQMIVMITMTLFKFLKAFTVAFAFFLKLWTCLLKLATWSFAK